MHVSPSEYSHTFQASKIAEATENAYANLINVEQKKLEAGQTQSANTAGDQAYQRYATIEVDGKSVAKVNNSGVVETSSSLGGKILALLAGDGGSQGGPDLAEERAAKIAEAFGGKVVKSPSAQTQVQFNASSEVKPEANQPAMQEGPAYEQLQKTKEATTLFLAQEMGQDTGGVEKVDDEKRTLDTAHGKQTLDVGGYFMPKSGLINLDEIPLLLPSANNIDALSAHASSKMQAFLATHNIPEGPAKITYDNNGQIRLPQDYAHADKFNQALTADPAMARVLQTTSALTSSYVGLQAAQGGNSTQNYSEIALTIASDGTLSVTADGKPYNKSGVATNATDTTNASDAEQAFLDYMSMTPAERYFEAMLKQEGMTKEQFDALPLEEQAEISDRIQKKMKEQIEDTVETAQNSGASVVPRLL